MITIHEGDCLEVLGREIEDQSINLIYTDPPFNTGKIQTKTNIEVTADEDGERLGFGGKRYHAQVVDRQEYVDIFDDYLGFMEPRLREMYRVLKPDGSLFLHMDYREVHYVKVLLDTIFGRKSFINEIIWSYDYGARSKKKWPAKHDNILWYAKDPKNYIFHYDQIDRIPYMAPDMVGPEKAEAGKTLTSVWWNTIVPTNGKEKTGYPTQKPRKIVDRIVRVHSNPGDTLLDCFAGSGTLGASAIDLGRNCTLIDNNPESIRIMHKRLDLMAGKG